MALRARSGSEPRRLRGSTSLFRGAAGRNPRSRRRWQLFLPRAMWPAGAGTKLPCPRDSALRRAAFSGNLTALPSHLVPAGRSVRVFISANPEGESLDRVCLSVLLSVRAAGAADSARSTAGCVARPSRSLPPAKAVAAPSAWEFHLNHFYSALAHPLCLLTSLRTPILSP